MKVYQLIGLIGILLLLICSFLPLAHLGDGVITIAPIFDNFDLEKSMWVWKDISAFAITVWITLVLCVFLSVKKYKPGFLISASLNLVAILFIYFSVWLTSIKVEEFGNVEFKLCYVWIILSIGYVLLYYSGLKIQKK